MIDYLKLSEALKAFYGYSGRPSKRGGSQAGARQLGRQAAKLARQGRSNAPDKRK